MHILVTGGLGGVGRPTVRWLLERGHHVRVLDLSVDRPIDGAECLEGDITDFASLGPAMAGIDGVIHLLHLLHLSRITVHTHVIHHPRRALHAAALGQITAPAPWAAVGARTGHLHPAGDLRVDHTAPGSDAPPHDHQPRHPSHQKRPPQLKPKTSSLSHGCQAKGRGPASSGLAQIS